jgi:tetratricopeptide (TPR) repeat protein
MRASTTASSIVVAALLLGSAAAQTHDAPAEARRHYDEGTKAFNLGEFARAVNEYRAAYNINPHPALLYNIAQSYRLAGDLAHAVFFYRSYLHNVPDATNRREVQERIAMLEAQLAEGRASGSAPGNGAPPPVPAGAHPEADASATQPSPSGLVAAQPSPPPPRAPLYKKWWLWTLVGAVAAGAAVGNGVGVSQSAPRFDATFGTVGPSSNGGR